VFIVKKKEKKSKEKKHNKNKHRKPSDSYQKELCSLTNICNTMYAVLLLIDIERLLEHNATEKPQSYNIKHTIKHIKQQFHNTKHTIKHIKHNQTH
jgi:hypothetical protein